MIQEATRFAAPPTPERDGRGAARKPRNAAQRGRRWRGLQMLLIGPLYVAALLTVALAWLFEALSIPGWTIDIDDPT